MLHLIQRHTFRDHHYQLFIDTVKRFDFPHQTVEIVPFTRELVYEDQTPIKVDTDNVFCWGSVRMAHIAKDYGWKPGSFHNDNHDYRVYSQYYKDEMLNYDSVIMKFGDEFKEPGYLFFARPCEDTKTFTGQVFTKASWDEFVQHSLTNGHSTTLNKDTAIQVCRIKDIQREIRVWVVKGKVITASQYRIGERTVYKHCDEPMILEYAQRMVDIYQPAEAFVLDVAMVDDVMKIVEINCINCAGFYECDLQKLLTSVEDAFGRVVEVDALSECVTSSEPRIVIVLDPKLEGKTPQRISEALDSIRTFSRAITIKNFPSTLDSNVCKHVKMKYEDFLKLDVKPRIVFVDTKE